MLRILYDDFDQKVKNIHDETDLHHSYKKKACTHFFSIGLRGIYCLRCVHSHIFNNSSMEESNVKRYKEYYRY